MGFMFQGCSSLASLDLSGFDTGAVTGMGYMFQGCSSLASLDLSGFDTGAVTYMGSMFQGCSSLKSLDLSGFDTGAVRHMGFMFFDCSSLASLDLSGFDTGAVTDMNRVFDRCPELARLTVGPNFAFHPAGASTNEAVLEGSWRSSADGQTYPGDSLPSLVAATYTRAGAAPEPQPGFDDVDGGTPHRDDVLWLASSGISTGWDNGDGARDFRPYAAVTRADMAAFLYRLAGEPAFDEGAVSFADVDEGTPHRRAILWLASEGISRGWTGPDGSLEFRPYAQIARCDMAAFLYRLAGEPAFAAGGGFADVDASTPHRQAVLWMAASGVSAGWTEADGTRTFRPYAQIVRCDMAAFLHRMADKGLVAPR